MALSKKEYSWPSGNTHPGETPEQALIRRVRFHEYLMQGGTPDGYVNGKMTYSDPVDPKVTPNCPWHNADGTGLPCEAWDKIVGGFSTGSEFSPTLKELRERGDDWTPKPREYKPGSLPTPSMPLAPRFVPLAEDARDTAVDELAFDDVPDEIVFDDDEDEDEDE